MALRQRALKGRHFSGGASVPQSYTSLYHHFIFGTKNRQPLIGIELQERLYAYIGGIIRSEMGTLIAAGGMPDHIHLLASLHGQASTSELMRLVKTNSSKWVHESFDDRREFAWQDGYGAFSVSFSALDRVKQYIHEQEMHHRKLTFEEEFAEFLNKHNIPYDERYLWK